MHQILEFTTQCFAFFILNSLYMAVLALLVLLLRLVIPRLPQSIEYGLWCLVLLRLVLPTELSFPFSISGGLKEWLVEIYQGEFVSTGELIRQLRFWNSNQWLRIGALVWLIVVCLVLSYYLWLRIQLLRAINRSAPIVSYDILSMVNRWRLTFWIRSSVHVIAEDRYLSPFTFFFKAPVIFIPRKILMTADQVLIESIIAHEMAHVKRKDSLWLLVQNLIQIVYFFNPLVWLIVRRMSGLRESICDQMVLSAQKITPKEYGLSLIKVLKFNIHGELASKLSNAFLGYENQIKARIEAINGFQKPRQLLGLGVVCWLIFAILFIPFLQQPPLKLRYVHRDPHLESPFPEPIRDQVKLPVVDDDE